MKRAFLLFFLALGFALTPTAELPAQKGLKLAKKIVRKVQKLFTDERFLEDIVLYENSRIIGTDPSFLINQNGYSKYHFNLFSDFIVGEYDINPETGLPRYEPGYDRHKTEMLAGKEKKNLLQVAREKNPRMRFLMLLSYRSDYSYDRESNAYLLRKFLGNDNRKAQDSLFLRLESLFQHWSDEYKIPEGNFGVALDFQGLPKDKRLAQHFHNFAQRLKESGYLVYVKLQPDFMDAGFYSDADAFAPLENIADLFILNGYSYEIENPSAYECTSPTDMRALENTLIAIRDKKLISPNQLAVEFPGFGRGCDKDILGYPFQKNVSNGVIAVRYAQNLQDIKYKDTAHYVYGHFPDPHEEGVNFCFEDSLTLTRKIQWLKTNNLAAGIGVWGVGYMNEGQKEQWWWAIANESGKPAAKVGWVYAGYAFLFISLGYIFPVFHYWEVRNILAKYSNIFWDHAMRFGIFTLVFLLCFNILPRNRVGLFICFLILGIFIVMRVIKRYRAKFKKYSRYAEKF